MLKRHENPNIDCPFIDFLQSFPKRKIFFPRESYDPPSSHFSLVAIALNLVVSLIYLEVSTIGDFSKFGDNFAKFGEVF
jgi:hypothetical protein